MSKPWPCKTCIYLRGPDTTNTHWCAAPVLVPLFLSWGHPYPDDPHKRYIGTPKQINGETENRAPTCPLYKESSNV